MDPVRQKLSELPAGTKAMVSEITVPPEHKRRLLEMGLLPGTQVELVRYAPMGDPLEIKVRNYHLSLRKHEADCIFVLVKPTA